MDYIEITIPADSALQEILIAELSQIDYEGFEELEASLKCYIEGGRYEEDKLFAALAHHGLSFQKQVIHQQNWNEQWEQSFEPVVVDDFCTIRAHFHEMDITTKHDIIITPKMSFGTGHHATTRLMVKQMAAIDLTGKSVFDFGTGTGVLAILAAKLGAAHILAIDNDEWSYSNTVENLERNNVKLTDVRHAVLDDVQEQDFDIILANINRHVLIQYMPQLYYKLRGNGIIIMSGLLRDDETLMRNQAEAQGFRFVETVRLDNWIAIRFEK